MSTLDFRSDRQNARWGEVRTLLPVVERWLAAVAVLLRQHETAESAGQSCIAGDVSSLAEPLSDCTAVGTEGLVGAPPPIRSRAGVPIDALSTGLDERLRLRLLFEQYKDCLEDISSHQWPAVCLRLRDGLTEAQIAVVLNKSRSSIHGLLKRARQVKEACRQRLRSERYRLARKNLNP